MKKAFYFVTFWVTNDLTVHIDDLSMNKVEKLPHVEHKAVFSSSATKSSLNMKAHLFKCVGHGKFVNLKKKRKIHCCEPLQIKYAKKNFIGSILIGWTGTTTWQASPFHYA